MESFDPQVILVTKDGAFWDKNKTKLNESLAKELNDAGLPCNSVVVLRTLDRVISEFLRGKLSDADWIRIRIENGEISDFADSSPSALWGATTWIHEHPDIFDNYQGSSIRGYTSVQFDRMKEVSFGRVNETIDLGSSEVVVRSEWTGTAVIVGYSGPNRSEHLDVALRFTMGSLIETMPGHAFVTEHDVSDMTLDSS